MSKAFVKEVEEKEEKIINKKESVKTENVISKIAIGVISVNNKLIRLLVGDDKHWYKQEAVGTTRLDAVNNTPLITVWSNECTLLSKKEFDSYFKVKS